MRLLISARDAGAAGHLIPVVEAALAHPGIEPVMCAAGPAAAIWRAAGIHFAPVTATGESLRDVARGLLAEHTPDGVLTGLSGPDAGIDEALLAAAAGRTPTFALQDFWGDLNSGFGRLADNYLVLDEAAAAITRRRAGEDTRAIVVGSPAHTRLNRMAVPLRNQCFRRRHRIAGDDQLTGLFSQPLWAQRGYRDSLRDFVRRVRSDRLIARPHPRETRAERMQLRRLLRRHCRVEWQFDSGDLWDLLAACDLTASVFSNTNHDRVQLNRLSRYHPGIPVYLQTTPGMRRLFRQWTGLDAMPPTASGMAITVVARGQLAPLLAPAAQPGMRRRLGDAAMRGLPDAGDAPDRVLRAILNVLR